MHWYKFNIADYRKDTAHLTMLEHGIYRTLIDWCYLDEQPIPKETQLVIRRLSLGSESVMALQNVLADFFVLGENGHTHKRVIAEILNYKENATKNIANGKLGGRPKKTDWVNLDNPNQTEGKGNHKPENQEPENQEPLLKNKSASAQSAYADLIVNIDKQVINDWKKLRAAKKSPVTRLVIEGLIREAGLAGYTLEQAMREGVERGWTSFKASWVVDKGGGYAQAPANKQQALEDRADATLKQYLASKELNNVVN